MTNLKTISVAALALAAAVVCFVIQHRSQTGLRANDALLQDQSNQLAALTLEHQRLSQLLARPAATRASNSAADAELARLRSEAETLKQQTNTLAHPAAKTPDFRPAPPVASRAPRTPEEIEQMRQPTRTAMELGLAFIMHARDHQNQSPTNFDQLAPYLAQRNTPLPDPNQFEIVYQGTLDQLQGIPIGTVAVIRSQQTWPGPDGKMSRIYSFLDGHSQIVGSDDNFQSWEALHVISPPNPGPSAR